MSSEAVQSEIIEEIKRKTIPQHVAIIMDGNGRWAQSHGRPRVFGHQKGLESVRETVEIANQLGIKVLTLYAFSDENWGRPEAEVSALMSLLDTYVVKERKKLHEANIKFHVIGNLERLPERTRKRVLETQKILSTNTGMILNIALSYGSRNEIVSACKEIVSKVINGTLKSEDIKPETITKHLWTREFPDPDLFIRTSGEQRISNFLLWQLAYTELWFTPVYWPEFRKGHFFEAIRVFQSRERRYGRI
jgi:undecaprenyl diphosphate synthase